MNVKTFFYTPCGDLNWMSHVSFPEGTPYISADIVPDLITVSTVKYSDRAGHPFRVIEIVHGALSIDPIWPCCDALAHLPNADGLAVLQNLVARDIPFLLLRSTPRNCELGIVAGEDSYANLRRPPFGLESRGSESPISSRLLCRQISCHGRTTTSGRPCWCLPTPCLMVKTRTEGSWIKWRKSEPSTSRVPSVLIVSARRSPHPRFLQLIWPTAMRFRSKSANQAFALISDPNWRSGG